MKIIDFCKKGNVVRFYLGADDLVDYGGDDWNDSPYDCNAGTVYDEYISAHIDVAFPFEYEVLEPCDGDHNCGYAKDDMKNGITPRLLIVPPERIATAPWHSCEFNYWVGTKDAVRIHFGDDIQELVERLSGQMIACPSFVHYESISKQRM